ncbi:curli assembly protein CsgF [Belnapia sp. F-4-1]|uniref:curli assembly protein CsgF n=1 Tax=Belnapia sp. F-4-1 TaxID=1545443 RepID=UPI00191755A7|nr:curli assembly protein CsgF [Belnapia sp. F-4-1]
MLGAAVPAGARDLVYTPVNPAFGGSPLNGTYVLGLATANNRFRTSPEQRQQERQTSLSNGQQFERQITSALLSQIASNIGQQILGENARDSGTFSIGGTSVQFQRIGGQISVDITEGSTGGRTNILIPAPAF